jgi:hypothetical protein
MFFLPIDLYFSYIFHHFPISYVRILKTGEKIDSSTNGADKYGFPPEEN